MISYYKILFIALCLIITKNIAAQNCVLHPPTNLYLADITSCSATLHWTSNTTGIKYTVAYKVFGTTNWSPQINVGQGTSHQFSGLSPNTKYDFAVKAKCTDGSVSQLKKKSATTLSCSLPDQVMIQGVNSHTVKITVNTSCTYNSVHVRYKTLNGSSQVLAFAPADSFLVSGLSFDSTYLFQVTTCPLSLNNWTAADTVHLQPPPNILFIIIDDSRYNYFSCNGAPSFFHTPNIDRIGNEGVNFKKAFVVTSLCAPSRASIATGLFTLKTGVTINGIHLDTSFTTIPKVLPQNGYYTALVGKNHDTFFQGEVPEFNYYLEQLGYDKYDGKKWNCNGAIKTISTDYPLTVTDTTIALIKRINSPFFIWLSPEIPHFPLLPLPSFEGKYDNETVNYTADTARYSVNYPSYLYSRNIDYLHGHALDSTYKAVLEVIAGFDSCVGEIFNALETSGKLDNTMIIFMSDNGFMLGNHWLNEKTLAYEPSMRTPLLVRYPKWFTPQSKVTDEFALNLDITPTVYEAAEVNYTGPLDGVSLKDLYDGTVSRKEFYYLMLHGALSDAPSKRAIRDQYFKYIHYSCNSDTVEELFDMVNDTLELTNLINNSAYNAIADIYRLKYDSIKTAWNDTAEGAIKNCYIQDPYILKQQFENEETIPDEPAIYPTLSSGNIEVYIPWTSATATLYDSFGKLVWYGEINETFSHLNFPAFPDGMYFLNLSYAGKSFTEKLVLTRK